MKYKQKETIPLNVILDCVCRYFDVSKKDIFERTRVKDIIYYRYWFFYFARTLNPKSHVTNTYIGSYSLTYTRNKWDNATIIYVENLMNDNIGLYNDYVKVKKDLERLINRKMSIYDGLKGFCVTMPFQINIYSTKQKKTLYL